jgi:hypothetical protein
MFSSKESSNIREFYLKVKKEAKPETTINIALLDSNGNFIDDLTIRLIEDLDKSPYEYSPLFFSIGTSFSVEKIQSLASELYFDLRYQKLDLFSKNCGIDAGLSSAVTSLSNNNKDIYINQYFERVYFENVGEVRYIPYTGSILKELKTRNTSLWLTLSYKLFESPVFVGLHFEYRKRSMELTNTIYPRDSAVIQRIEGKNHSGIDTNFIYRAKLGVSRTTYDANIGEGIFGVSVIFIESNPTFEAYLKVIAGLRFESRYTPIDNFFDKSLIQQYKESEKDTTCKNCVNAIRGVVLLPEMITDIRNGTYAIQFRFLEKKYGFKFGGDLRGIGGFRPDIFIYLAKEFSITKMGDALFGKN